LHSFAHRNGQRRKAAPTVTQTFLHQFIVALDGFAQKAAAAIASRRIASHRKSAISPKRRQS
jgi:hypothetical protein